MRYIDADKLEEWVYAFHLADAYWAIPMLKNAPTSDVVPRSEVAREVFEKIENQLRGMLDHFRQNYDVRESGAIIVALSHIAELKKKYTEK